MQFVRYTPLFQTAGQLGSYLLTSVLVIKGACMQTQMLFLKGACNKVCCEAKTRILCHRRPQICGATDKFLRF